MANYTVNIDGINYPVVYRPWGTVGFYSDEMNLQTMAVQIARSPSNSALRRAYDALLQRKLNSENEIADIKDQIKRAKERFASVYPPGFKQERLAALQREQDAEFDRENVGGKKRKKMSNKISNKRKKHSRRRRTHSRRRRTHSRSKY
jgi:predicted  nucleic acid-binding Zn-ribbon protein